jgi:hypothetical protein
LAKPARRDLRPIAGPSSHFSLMIYLASVVEAKVN